MLQSALDWQLAGAGDAHVSCRLQRVSGDNFANVELVLRLGIDATVPVGMTAAGRVCPRVVT